MDLFLEEWRARHQFHAGGECLHCILQHSHSNLLFIQVEHGICSGYWILTLGARSCGNEKFDYTFMSKPLMPPPALFSCLVSILAHERNCSFSFSNMANGSNSILFSLKSLDLYIIHWVHTVQLNVYIKLWVRAAAGTKSSTTPSCSSCSCPSSSGSNP